MSFWRLLCCLLLAGQLHASHIVGSDIYYDYLGNDQYRLYVTLFRDCFSDGAEFDNPMSLGIFKPNGQTYLIVNVPFAGRFDVPIEFSNPCVTTPSNLCVERSTYTTVVTLPASTDGYVVSYQRCCYGPAITNVVNPGNIGLTITTTIPGNPYAANNSPRFVNFPPLIICNTVDLNMMHHATDADGDDLIYDFVTPFNGGTSVAPMPQPPSGPPYNQIPWEPGYSESTTLGPGATTDLNPNTGALFVDANQLGKYVVGIRVREYRNGVLIGQTVRAFIFNVINCVVQLQADITAQASTPGFINVCQGLGWTFDNNSFGGSTYSWNFGDPASGASNTSNAFQPTHNFSAEGEYQVSLIVNEGWPCTDTDWVTIQVYRPLEVDFTHEDSTCAALSELDFQGILVLGDPTTVFSWEFPPEASNTVSTGMSVPDVHFSEGGSFPVMFKAVDGVCRDSVTKIVTIFDDALADFEMPEDYRCVGRNQNFINTSQDASIYSWNFGDPAVTTDVSNQVNPNYFYSAPGSYTITLIANNVGGCADTVSKVIQVNELMELDFTFPDSLCITDNQVDFDGTYSGPGPVTFEWNFGSAAPASALTIDVNDVHFLHWGSNPVTLTAFYDVCELAKTDFIHLLPAPIVNFRLRDELQCAPFTAQFIDMSFAPTSLTYYWDFGDGNTSTEENPAHVYGIPGAYPVSLTITSSTGCIDTLTMTKDNIVFVHPSPIADFELNVTEVTVCDTVLFIDGSEGASFWRYQFGDFGVSSESDPRYQYARAGTYYPVLTVSNEFGCIDTASGKIDVEPFPFYVPNAFTPDYNDYNQYFGPVFGLTPEEYTFEVYNKWGELLFSTHEPTDLWDGTFNGLASPDGVYTWKLTFRPCDTGHDLELHTGHATLLR